MSKCANKECRHQTHLYKSGVLQHVSGRSRHVPGTGFLNTNACGARIRLPSGRMGICQCEEPVPAG